MCYITLQRSIVHDVTLMRITMCDITIQHVIIYDKNLLARHLLLWGINCPSWRDHARNLRLGRQAADESRDSCWIFVTLEEEFQFFSSENCCRDTWGQGDKPQMWQLSSGDLPHLCHFGGRLKVFLGERSRKKTCCLGNKPLMWLGTLAAFLSFEEEFPFFSSKNCCRHTCGQWD